MALTGIQTIELFIGTLIAVFIIAMLYVLGILRIKPSKRQERPAVQEYRPLPNMPRPQIVIRNRTFDYEGFDMTNEDIDKGIEEGTLLYNDGEDLKTFPRKLNLNDDFDIDMARTIKENRTYIKVVENKTKTNKDLALEATRATIEVLSKKNKILEDKIDEMNEDEQAKKERKQMYKGVRLTSRAVGGYGQSPKSLKERKAELNIKQPQKEIEDEDENEENTEDEDEDEFD